jgi:enediyne biosynthesis protein E4
MTVFSFSSTKACSTYHWIAKKLHGCCLVISVALLYACGGEVEKKENTLFKQIPSSTSGISFSNDLVYTEELNPYIFRNFYNGGGVGLGDVNNDGLLDIFLSGNLVSNKLYLNKGNFAFADITENAGLGSEGVWTTGVSMVDINADGLLDIYICKSGPPGGGRRHNELFINNGDLTFTEKSVEYGLASEGLSTHAAFFDYDKDGDLDCYLLNNSIRTVGGYDLRKNQREIPDPDGGNKLYRNDDGKFKDVSLEAGIYTSSIGFGLGVTIGDINKDGWEDIYVSNDFFEKDYLYLNNGDGTFSESLEQLMREISMGSMGADMADINNDGLPEIFVTEMLPEKDDRLKTTTQFEKWDKYELSLKQGYYHQFSRNVLQLNNGQAPGGTVNFSEISRMAGVDATDWSWGALIFDMDNDGYKDIFVANGIYKDLLDQDYVNFVGDPDVVRSILNETDKVIKQLIDSIPSHRIANYAFQNQGGITFKNFATQWGLDQLTHSNGSAYGDLDNDGDLDLVLNNVNMPASLYENQSEKINPLNKHISISLESEGANRFAIGSKVTVYVKDKTLYQELAPMRGFMSSVDYKLHFGTGDVNQIDSIKVEWPDGQISLLRDLQPNGHLIINQQKTASGNVSPSKSIEVPTIFSSQTTPKGLEFVHRESDFVDFDRDRLLFNMISNEGPCLCVGDVNGDGFDDLYIGGAKGQSGGLFVQQGNGSFRSTDQSLLKADETSEDTDCQFFDANKDGLLDLYVTSGSNEFSSSSSSLLDRLYINQGAGIFAKSKQFLPVSDKFESTSVVKAADYDKDGDIDLFVGTRVTPFAYGQPKNGYILNNDGKGGFRNITMEVAPALLEMGLITDAVWADFNNDGALDLAVVGEWMPVRLLLNDKGQFVDATAESGFGRSAGWINTIETGDFNNDGYTDIVTGNHGLNSRFKATSEEPVSLYIDDFDQNGSVEHILTRYQEGKELPMVMRTDLVMQIPSLKKKYLRFSNYKNQTMKDIFLDEQLKSSLVLKAYDFSTAVWLNLGNGTFEKSELPKEAQLSPVYTILVTDFDDDGNLDMLLGGNQYRAKPETGIYDGSYGLLLKGAGNGTFDALAAIESGILTKGQVRRIQKIQLGDKKAIIIGKNNDSLEVFNY